MTEYDLVLDVLRHRPRPRALHHRAGPVPFDDEAWSRAAGSRWAYDVLAGLPDLAERLGLDPPRGAVAGTWTALADLSAACGGLPDPGAGDPDPETEARALLLRARAALLGTVLDERERMLLRLRVAPVHPRTLAEAAVAIGMTRYEAHRAERELLARLRGTAPPSGGLPPPATGSAPAGGVCVVP
ncbi:sigma factor-like helix-turn-helix DNA-binding protein [Phycicoccus avicenniae]|uniref:sigma factor-like helix-turn-helix DNA-binding protein n=1 Tax=Phycicoccus avicenniae TaxID=2828860 RepID=UPI003D2E1960